MKQFIIVLLMIFCVTSIANALNFTNFARKAANVADNVPIHRADELAETLTHSKASREALENAAKRVVKSADPSILKNAVKSELHAIDPSLVRFADDLPKPSQEYLIVLGNGAKSCEKNMPDILQRAKFLERGGAETVTAIGMYGDDTAKTAMRLDAAIHSGKLVSPKGIRTVSLVDYGKLFTKYGDAANNFWSKYVTPHWEKWLIGGALAWYLIDPEGFMDTVGNLTEEGLKRLTQCAGDIAAKAISGISKGVEQAVEKVGVASVEAVKRTAGNFFTSWTAFVGYVVVAFFIACCLPFTRFYILKPIKFLLKKPR
ncbi:MAG: hypothetical protein LBP87_11040 [Planctomycetaceae bacterium]|jgi:hypothetical protein|nr:hypothetical protein [Planctomycetaceae bacterium]